MLRRRLPLVALLGSLLVLSATAHASQAPLLTPRVYLASIEAADSCDFPLGTPGIALGRCFVPRSWLVGDASSNISQILR
jgi:hypothetical protein